MSNIGDIRNGDPASQQLVSDSVASGRIRLGKVFQVIVNNDVIAPMPVRVSSICWHGDVLIYVTLTDPYGITDYRWDNILARWITITV
jgi:hypothetical protein